MWDVPYAGDKFNIGFVALFRALGWLDNAAIKAAILYNIAHFFTQPRVIPWNKVEKYIDDSLQHDAARCRTQVRGEHVPARLQTLVPFPPSTPQVMLIGCSSSPEI
jgi:hypothetical protein